MDSYRFVKEVRQHYLEQSTFKEVYSTLSRLADATPVETFIKKQNPGIV